MTPDSRPSNSTLYAVRDVANTIPREDVFALVPQARQRALDIESVMPRAGARNGDATSRALHTVPPSMQRSQAIAQFLTGQVRTRRLALVL
jgi:hypothetical protein